MRLISITIAVILLFASASQAQYPITVNQPAGTWVLYHRPCPIVELCFGPIWVFIPSQQRPPQTPAPAFNSPVPKTESLQIPAFSTSAPQTNR